MTGRPADPMTLIRATKRQITAVGQYNGGGASGDLGKKQEHGSDGGIKEHDRRTKGKREHSRDWSMWMGPKFRLLIVLSR